jgi:hypothetical protein
MKSAERHDELRVEGAASGQGRRGAMWDADAANVRPNQSANSTAYDLPLSPSIPALASGGGGG